MILWMLLAACGESDVNQGENFGNLLDSSQGLVLTEAEHEGGWGRTQCSTCHNLENIHLVNRTGIPLDIEAVHNQAIADGPAGCSACHGTNGATP